MEKKSLTISLLVPVYNGGIYWSQCIESINNYGSLFDNILISINKGTSQLEDTHNANKISIKNKNILIQDKLLSPVEHFCEIVRHVTTDYVFILAHDDLLLENVYLVKEKIMKEGFNYNISILGTFKFFNDSQELGTVREIYDNSISKDEFIEYDLAKYFDINISGMCLPVDSIKVNLKYITKFTRGIRLDYLLLTNNKIIKIYQINKPTVAIRIHEKQEGKIIEQRERFLDSILYFMYHLIESKDIILKEKLKKELIFVIFYPLKKLQFYSVLFYFKNTFLFISKQGILKYLKFNMEILSFIIQKSLNRILKAFL